MADKKNPTDEIITTIRDVLAKKELHDELDGHTLDAALNTEKEIVSAIIFCLRDIANKIVEKVKAEAVDDGTWVAFVDYLNIDLSAENAMRSVVDRISGIFDDDTLAQRLIELRVDQIRKMKMTYGPIVETRYGEMLRDLIAQKWTLGADLGATKTNYLVNARGNVPTLENVALLHLHGIVGKRSKKIKETSEMEQAFKATKVILDPDAPPFNTRTNTILQWGIALFFANLGRGGRESRYKKFDPSNLGVKIETSTLADMMGVSQSTAQRYLRDAIKTLEAMRLETEDFYLDSGGKKVHYGKGNPRIISSHKRLKGAFILYLDAQFAEYLIGSYRLEVPEIYFRLSANARAIVYELAVHEQMNSKHANRNTIGVRTLVEQCPEIDEKRRDKERVIEPFERAMEECEGAITWEYEEAGGHSLSKASILDYTLSEFMDLNIKFEFREKPEWAVRDFLADKPVIVNKK